MKTRDTYGILFAEDFDDDDGGPTLDGEPSRSVAFEDHPGVESKAAPVEQVYSAADLAQARRASHESGYAEGLAAASEAAATARTSVLAALAERLTAARAGLDAMVAQQLDEVTHATLAVVSACLPVLCEHAGTRDLMVMLQDLLPSLVAEPELVVTVHPDQAVSVEQELLRILGKNTPLQVHTSPSMGRSDVDIAWRSGSAKRNTRALRREVTGMLRRSLRSQASPLTIEEHRHGR